MRYGLVISPFLFPIFQESEQRLRSYILHEIIVDAENAEEAAKWAACTDGMENALFRVYELSPDGFGGMEKAGDPEYFNF